MEAQPRFIEEAQSIRELEPRFTKVEKQKLKPCH